MQGCLAQQGGPESDQDTFVYGSELVDWSFYVVRDNDTFAVVDELLVVGSCGVSTLVGGGIGGIGDLAYGVGNVQLAFMREKCNLNYHHRLKLPPTPSQVPASIRLLTVASISSWPSSPDLEGFNLIYKKKTNFSKEFELVHAI